MFRGLGDIAGIFQELNTGQLIDWQSFWHKAFRDFSIGGYELGVAMYNVSVLYRNAVLVFSISSRRERK